MRPPGNRGRSPQFGGSTPFSSVQGSSMRRPCRSNVSSQVPETAVEVPRADTKGPATGEASVNRTASVAVEKLLDCEDGPLTLTARTGLAAPSWVTKVTSLPGTSATQRASESTLSERISVAAQLPEGLATSPTCGVGTKLRSAASSPSIDRHADDRPLLVKHESRPRWLARRETGDTENRKRRVQDIRRRL